jgi:hypothetical protein
LLEGTFHLQAWSQATRCVIIGSRSWRTEFRAARKLENERGNFRKEEVTEMEH